MQAAETKVLLLGAGVAIVGIVLLKTAGVRNVAASLGSGAVDVVGGAVGGVTTGVVTGVSEAIGIPTPMDTTTDAQVARWLIDTQGYWTASLWVGVPALYEAATMEEGSGRPPPAGSAIALKFGTAPYEPMARIPEEGTWYSMGTKSRPAGYGG